MGQLYASREILFNCKIFSVQRLWSSLWEEWVEVNWVIRWNVKITRWNWSRTTAGTSYYYNYNIYIYVPFLFSTWVYSSQEWSVTFCLVFCDIGSGVSVTLMIPTFLEEWNSKQLQMEKCETENLNPISWLVREINRNSFKVELYFLCLTGISHISVPPQ